MSTKEKLIIKKFVTGVFEFAMGRSVNVEALQNAQMAQEAYYNDRIAHLAKATLADLLALDPGDARRSPQVLAVVEGEYLRGTGDDLGHVALTSFGDDSERSSTDCLALVQ